MRKKFTKNSYKGRHIYKCKQIQTNVSKSKKPTSISQAYANIDRHLVQQHHCLKKWAKYYILQSATVAGENPVGIGDRLIPYVR